MPSVYDTTFDPVDPTRELQGPVAWFARWIWKPVSLSELSWLWSVLEEAVAATAAKFDGAARGRNPGRIFALTCPAGTRIIPRTIEGHDLVRIPAA